MINLLPRVFQYVSQDMLRFTLGGEHIAIRLHIQPGFTRAVRDSIFNGFMGYRVLCGVWHR